MEASLLAANLGSVILFQSDQGEKKDEQAGGPGMLRVNGVRRRNTTVRRACVAGAPRKWPMHSVVDYRECPLTIFEAFRHAVVPLTKAG